MSHNHPGELPEQTGALTQGYIDLFEGIALGDPFQASEASRQLRDAEVPHGRLIERLCKETESAFLDRQTLDHKKLKFISHRGLKSMVYGGSFDPTSPEQVNSLKTSLALLGISRKWLKHTLGLDAGNIERAGYTDKGYGKEARKLGKQALKVLLPEHKGIRLARTAGWQLLRGLNLYYPDVGSRLYRPEKSEE